MLESFQLYIHNIQITCLFGMMYINNQIFVNVIIELVGKSNMI